MRKVDLQLASDALVLEADRGEAAELARCLGLFLAARGRRIARCSPLSGADQR
jgi:hypothetical protein